MKKLLTLMLFVGMVSAASAQFCNTATNQGAITPTTTTQTTGVVNSGRPYWTFVAQAGCTYTFATCGLSGVDTYLRLYSTAAGGTILASSDDACGSQSSITWYCATTGTYSILITRYSFLNNCNTLNGNVQMSYVMDCTPNPQNCLGATQVCSDVAFSGNSNGFGAQELPNDNTIDGCLTIEHQSSWYYFQPVTSGTVSLTIQTAVDYDFAIWTGTCGNLGSPVRCSYAGSSGNTGLGNGAVDFSESAVGDRWVAPLAVVAGQTYIMLIDNFTSNSTPFTLDWTFSGGATLNCNPVILPLELVEWMANYDRTKNANQLYWQTATERYNDHFTVEHSVDAINWEAINEQPGQENSTVPTHYSYDDIQFVPGKTNYYRLSQTDYDGTIETFDVIAVDNEKNMRKVVKVYNTMGQEIPMDSPGLVILQYDDGTTSRIMR